ncbi:hypothetical protein J6590_088798 [Homalodisca vitripennis]|nr:hypothetical protein J6590_088798 [Homalodisca vitripennis]
MRSFSTCDFTGLNMNLKDVSTTRDCTDHGRKLLKELLKELDERKKNGETDLRLKYFNGIPKIQQSSGAVSSNIKSQVTTTSNILTLSASSFLWSFLLKFVISSILCILHPLHLPQNTYFTVILWMQLCYLIIEVALQPLIGDFSLPNVNWIFPDYSVSSVKCLRDLFDLIDLRQLNSIPNHTGTILDPVFSNVHSITLSPAIGILVPAAFVHPALCF